MQTNQPGRNKVLIQRTVRAEPVDAPVVCSEALRQAQGERCLGGIEYK
jgi:hypothetical protein